MMLLAVLLLQLTFSSRVLGLPQHMQQTHMLLTQQQQGSSSSWSSLCGTNGVLSESAAALVTSSLVGDPKIQITAVNLAGSCGSVKLLQAVQDMQLGGGLTHDHIQHQQATVLLSSTAAALASSSSSSSAGRTVYRLFPAADSGGTAAAGSPQPDTAAAAAAAVIPADALALLIDFIIAPDSAFFSDIVLQYSTTHSPVSQSSTALQPSIWIEPAHISFTGSIRTRLMPPTGRQQQQDVDSTGLPEGSDLSKV
jgi:hypothetical protein